MIRNARTFSGELRDRDGFTIDLDALAQLPSLILLTGSDQSPPLFGTIITRLVEAVKSARVNTLPEGGHVPHLTHPDMWVPAVTEFVRGVK